MEDQVISIKTAQLLKDKDFNWEVRHYYTVKSELEEFLYYQMERSYKDYSGYPDDLLYMAPTQSLLSKWLRDIHEIEIDIKSTIEEYEYSIWKRGINDDFDIIFLDGNFDYEITLEIALEKALKLIK